MARRCLKYLQSSDSLPGVRNMLRNTAQCEVKLGASDCLSSGRKEEEGESEREGRLDLHGVHPRDTFGGIKVRNQ